MKNTSVIISIILILLIIIEYILLKLKRTSYKRYIKYAAKALEKLETIDNDTQKILFLRNQSSHVFEEMVLLSFEHYGFKVYRHNIISRKNATSGYVLIDEIYRPIKAKIYKSLVNKKDIRLFSQMCFVKRYFGLFLHTGIINDETKKSNHAIQFIDDKELLNLLSGSQNDFSNIKVKI